MSRRLGVVLVLAAFAIACSDDNESADSSTGIDGGDAVTDTGMLDSASDTAVRDGAADTLLDAMPDGSSQSMTDSGCPSGSYCAPTECDGSSSGQCVEVPIACDGVAEIAQPVCGCDGRTYPNGCYLKRARVGAETLGACESSGSVCRDSRDCIATEYCEREGTRGGVCLERPVVCAPIDAPVCGFDGNTHANDCERKAAGVAFGHEGECTLGRACSADRDCIGLGVGVYCKRPFGSCGAMGQCTRSPSTCRVSTASPVCGCDGNTYGSECEAAAGGTSTSRFGQCDTGAACLTSFSCGAGRYCRKPSVQCDGVGVCEPVPPVCGGVMVRVCGCDGAEYNSACLAAGAGVSVRNSLGCLNTCSDNSDCARGEICEFQERQCGGGGLCQPQPSSCPPVGATDPGVCGCDGVGYRSKCFANAAGVSVLNQGSCPTPCQSTQDCDSDETCNGCFGRGVCEPASLMCEPTSPAVCGCAFGTAGGYVGYANRCEALRMRVGNVGPGSCRDYGYCVDDTDCPTAEAPECFFGQCVEDREATGGLLGGLPFGL